MKKFLLSTVAALALTSGVAYADSINSLQLQFDDVRATAVQINVPLAWDDDLDAPAFENSAQAVGNSSDITGIHGVKGSYASGSFHAGFNAEEVEIDGNDFEADEINSHIGGSFSSASFSSTTKVSVKQVSTDDVTAYAKQINAQKAEGELSLNHTITNSALAVGNISTIKLK